MSDDVDSGFGVNSINVVDNSIATVSTTNTPLNILPSINPVFSSDGRDNILVEEKDKSEVYDKFGDDFGDFKLYGQQNLNALHTISGGGAAYLCRLMPSDSIRSSLIIKVGVKAVTDIPLYKRDAYGEYVLDDDGNKIRLTATQSVQEEVVGADGSTTTQTVEKKVDASVSGIKIKLFAESVSAENISKYSNLERVSELFDAVKVDAESGYTIYPLMFLAYYGRGVCGNNYGVYIENDLARDDKTDDGRRYQLYLAKKMATGSTILDSCNGLGFSFNPDALVTMYGTTVESLKTVYSNYDSDNNERPVQVFPYEDVYSQLTAQLDTLLSADTTVTTGFDADYKFRKPDSGEDLDFINGLAKDGYSYDTIEIDSTGVKLSNINYLQGGSDGSFGTLTGTKLSDAKDALLTSFFNCDVDTAHIMDVLQCDGAIIYDANYSMAIKKAMANMVKYRRDVTIVYDCKETESLTEAVAVAQAVQELVPTTKGENFAIIPHFGITVDRSVNVRVSGTYEMAYGLAKLYKTTPFGIYAGKPSDQGCVRTMKFDWVVEEGKPRGYNEKLAKTNRLYYAIDLGKAVSTLAEGNLTGRNVYFYANSNLYNTKLSKLSEFRNGLLTNDIRRMMKLVLVKYTFDTNGAESSIEGATEELTKLFSTRYPSNVIISLSLYQTSRDAILNQATCEATVTFPDIFETWNCKIIAARNSSEEA